MFEKVIWAIGNYIESGKNKKGPKAGEIHDGLPRQASFGISCMNKEEKKDLERRRRLSHKTSQKGKGNGKGDEAEEEEPEEVSSQPLLYYIPTPVAKHKDLDHIAPFWGVSRCSRQLSQDNNMAFEEMIFTIPWPSAGTGISTVGFKGKRSLPEIMLMVVGMRNTKRIEPGQVLTLPFFSETDENSVATGIARATSEPA